MCCGIIIFVLFIAVNDLESPILNVENDETIKENKVQKEATPEPTPTTSTPENKPVCLQFVNLTLTRIG